jgi:hypothetical protein
LDRGEGAVASVREGAVRIDDDDEDLVPGSTLIAPPAEAPRTVRLRAERPSRVIRVVHGRGHGFVREPPMARRGAG